MAKILELFRWNNAKDDSVTQGPPEVFVPSPIVIKGYAKDIEKYGEPLDSGLPAYFRKVADYYDETIGSIKQGYTTTEVCRCEHGLRHCSVHQEATTNGKAGADE